MELQQTRVLERNNSTTSVNSLFEETTYELSSVAPLFTCPLCGGYLVDAVAITECHHRFCKSCIYQYFFEDTFNRQKQKSLLQYPPLYQSGRQYETLKLQSSAPTSSKNSPSNANGITDLQQLALDSSGYGSSNSSNSGTAAARPPRIVNTCPVCGTEAHKSMPWTCLVQDTDWQTLMYLLIPRAFKKEQGNRKKFWRSRGFTAFDEPKEGEQVENRLKRSHDYDHNMNSSAKAAGRTSFEFEFHDEILRQFPPISIVQETEFNPADPGASKDESPNSEKKSSPVTDDAAIVTYHYTPKRQKLAAKKTISQITTQDLVEWTWIQCENNTCLKWRRVPPDSFDEKKSWYCRMNVVKDYNKCYAQEEDYKLYNKAIEKNEDQIGYIYSELPEGSIVWAKVGLAAPKWPGVICRHPHDQNFVEYDEDGDIFAYHIEFLGKPHTSGFSLACDTEIYSRHSGEKARKQKQSKASRKKNLLIALDEADQYCRLKDPSKILKHCIFYTNPRGLDGRTNIHEKEQMEAGKKKKCKRDAFEREENDEFVPYISLTKSTKLSPLKTVKKKHDTSSTKAQRTKKTTKTQAAPKTADKKQRKLIQTPLDFSKYKPSKS